MNALDQIKKAWEAVRETQALFAACGATDTEPSAEVQDCIRSALYGQKFKAKTIREWQIFPSDKKRGRDSNAAKQALNRTTRKLCDLVLKHRGTTKIASYLIGECWRVGIDRWTIEENL